MREPRASAATYVPGVCYPYVGFGQADCPTAQNEITEFIKPWRMIRIFDHNDLRAMEPELSDEVIAKGEVICLAAI
jgi:hypothetical protein